MTDGKRSCLGFVSLVLALVISISFLVAGGIGAFVKKVGGNFLGLDLRVGFILSVSAFLFFAIIAIYMFLKVKDYSWIPVILAGLYTILPDLVLGPQDDVLTLVFGAVISALLAWRKQKQGKPASTEQADELPLLEEELD